MVFFNVFYGFFFKGKNNNEEINSSLKNILEGNDGLLNSSIQEEIEKRPGCEIKKRLEENSSVKTGKT